MDLRIDLISSTVDITVRREFQTYAYTDEEIRERARAALEDALTRYFATKEEE